MDSISWKAWFEATVGKFPDLRTAPAAFKKASAALVDPDALATDAQFRQDMTDLVRLVFSTAAQCMAAYRDYKDKLGLIDFDRADEFERAEIPEQRRRLADPGLSYFSEANGIRDFLSREKANPRRNKVWISIR